MRHKNIIMECGDRSIHTKTNAWKFNETQPSAHKESPFLKAREKNDEKSAALVMVYSKIFNRKNESK